MMVGPGARFFQGSVEASADLDGLMADLALPADPSACVADSMARRCARNRAVLASRASFSCAMANRDSRSALANLSLSTRRSLKSSSPCLDPAFQPAGDPPIARLSRNAQRAFLGHHPVASASARTQGQVSTREMQKKIHRP
jgi:hypothetical protein